MDFQLNGEQRRMVATVRDLAQSEFSVSVVGSGRRSRKFAERAAAMAHA